MYVDGGTVWDVRHGIVVVQLPARITQALLLAGDAFYFENLQ